MEYGVIAPLRGAKYVLMKKWLELFRSCSHLYIFGAGNRGKLLLKWLREEHIEVEAFIDSDVRLQGELIEGVPVQSKEIALSRNCKIIISPNEYEEIERFFLKEGYQENEDYFIARQIEIPRVGSQKIFLNNNLFQQVRNIMDMESAVPFPVYIGDKIVDYYKVNYSMLLYDSVLNNLLAEDNGDNIQYLDLYHKQGGVVLQEWDELSNGIMYFFRKHHIPVFFDGRMLKEGYSDVDMIQYNVCEIEDDSNYYFIEQDYGFLIRLLEYNDLAIVIPHAMRLQKEGVNFVIARIPEFEELDNVSADEKFRNSNSITGYSHYYDKREEQVKKVYGDDYQKWRRREIGNIVQYYEGNTARLKDTIGQYTNVIHGIRKTTSQPQEYKNKIYILGPCIVGGAYVSDDCTIPSILQEKLNREYPNMYKVENMGICGGPRSYMEKVRKLDLYRGDYILLIDIFSKEFIRQYDHLLFIDLMCAFRKRTQDVFFEKPTHMNKFGNRLVCDEIYSKMVWNICELDSKRLVQKGSGLWDIDIEKEFAEYKKELRKVKEGMPENVRSCGAIVMNCNPFTYGHLYLIEQAMHQVNYLFVFVVEEDKSFFPFRKRMEMVEESCKAFHNVKVLPSGRIILSSYTLPEYFRKNDLQNVFIDPTKDVEIFAKYIAPELNITKRFVGEEPYDTVTRQYNERMKEILPQTGIELVEIPRFAIDGEIVSATSVRKWMKEKKHEFIQKMVPQSTYDVIKKMMV